MKKIQREGFFSIVSFRTWFYLFTLATCVYIFSACGDEKNTDLGMEQSIDSIESEAGEQISTETEEDTAESDVSSESEAESYDSIYFGSEEDFEAFDQHTDGVLQENVFYTQLNYWKAFGSLMITERQVDDSYYYVYYSTEDEVEILVNVDQDHASVFYQDKQFDFDMSGKIFDNEAGRAILYLVDLTGDGVKDLVYDSFFYPVYSEQTGDYTKSKDEVHIWDLTSQKEIPIEDITSDRFENFEIEIIRAQTDGSDTGASIGKFTTDDGAEYCGYVYSDEERTIGEKIPCEVTYSYFSYVAESNLISRQYELQGKDNALDTFAILGVTYTYDDDEKMFRIGSDYEVQMYYDAAFYDAIQSEGQAINVHSSSDYQLDIRTSSVNASILSDIMYYLNQEQIYNIVVQLLYEIQTPDDEMRYQVYQADTEAGTFYIMYEGEKAIDYDNQYIWSMSQVKFVKDANDTSEN